MKIVIRILNVDTTNENVMRIEYSAVQIVLADANRNAFAEAISPAPLYIL